MRKKVVLYDVELDDLKHPKLVARKRRTYETEDDEPFDHIAVARMLCKCFRLADMAEEYIYAMAFTTRGGCWGFLNWRTALATAQNDVSGADAALAFGRGKRIYPGTQSPQRGSDPISDGY